MIKSDFMYIFTTHKDGTLYLIIHGFCIIFLPSIVNLFTKISPLTPAGPRQ